MAEPQQKQAGYRPNLASGGLASFHELRARRWVELSANNSVHNVYSLRRTPNFKCILVVPYHVKFYEILHATRSRS
jgi:hypothetical protein